MSPGPSKNSTGPDPVAILDIAVMYIQPTPRFHKLTVLGDFLRALRLVRLAMFPHTGKTRLISFRFVYCRHSGFMSWIL